jgi:hypothetical protein
VAPRHGLVLLLGLLAFDVMVIAALALVGLPVLPASEDTTTAPPPPPPPPPPPAATVTAADRVLDDVIGADPAALFGDVERAQDPTDLLFGSPFAAGCDDFSGGTAPTVARSRQANLGGAIGVTLQVWAFGAGQGPRALTLLEETLSECRDSARGRPSVSTPDEGAGAGRLRVSSRSGDGVVWLVFQRGDVLAAVTASDLSGAAPTSLAAEIASRVDGILEAELAGVCPDQAAPESDAARNPYGSLPYEPFAREVVLTAPVFPDSLLPPEVPEPSFAVPAPRSFPDLAPRSRRTLAPATPAAPGQPPVAARTEVVVSGPAPSLVDPSAISRPEPYVTSPPTEPERPEFPDGVVAGIPLADEVGPGCGWAFTGQEAPSFDEERLQLAADEALQAAKLELAAAAAQWKADEARFLGEYADFQLRTAAYSAYQEYQRVRANAQAALERARRNAQPPPPPPAPPPLPSPRPSPTETPSPTAPPGDDEELEVVIPTPGAPSPTPPPPQPTPEPVAPEGQSVVPSQ